MPTTEPGAFQRHLNATMRAFPTGFGLAEVSYGRLSARRPDEVVAEGPDGRLTAAELICASQAIAYTLVGRGVQAGDMVAVVLPRGVRSLAARLGVAATGAVCLPVDPTHPAARIDWMLGDCGVAFAVVDPATEPLAAAVSCVDVDSAMAYDGACALPRPQSDAPVLALYTSGSTGQPKAALWSHEAILNLLRTWEIHPGMGPGDVMVGVASPAFDMSVLEAFLPLLAGARAVFVDVETSRDGRRLGVAIDRHAGSFLLATPTTFRSLLAGSWRPRRDFTAVCGGEALDRPLVDALLERGCAVWNGYGVTEAAACSALARIGPVEPVTIGRATDNATIWVLDEAGQPVGPGGVGELWIGGAGVGLGYLNRPELTAERFIVPAFTDAGRCYRTGDLGELRGDGRIVYRGRIDAQVKVRGARVELGEVRAALLDHPAVSAAAVVAVQEAESKRLVAFVVARDGEAPGAGSLRQWVAERLPAAMVPGRVVAVDKLPTGSTGKVDHRALVALVADSTETRAANPPVARSDGDSSPALDSVALAAHFSAVLGLHIDVANDFFVSGGDSLLAMRLCQRIQKATGRPVAVADVFEAPSPAQLAQRLASGNPILPLEPVAADSAWHPATSAQRRMWLLHRLDPESAAYNTAIEINVDDAIDPSRLQRALDLLVLRHPALRTQLRQTDSGVEQSILKAAPVSLETAADEAAIASMLARPFRLDRGDVFRATLVPRGDHSSIVLAVHHAACDGWSLPVLARDLAAAYEAPQTFVSDGATATPLSITALAHWEAANAEPPRAEAALNRWRNRLSGAPATTPLPRHLPPESDDLERPVAVRVPLAANLSRRLTDHCAATGATPFAAMLASFAGWLHLETGLDDVVVGTMVAGRERAGLDEVVGFVARTLALRIKPDSSLTASDLTGAVRAETVAALADQHVPFEQIVSAASNDRKAGSSLYDVLFMTANREPAPLSCDGCTWRSRERLSPTSPHPLVVELLPSGGVAPAAVRLRGDAKRVDVRTLQHWADRWLRFAEQSFGQPAATLGAHRANADSPLVAKLVQLQGVRDAAVVRIAGADGRVEVVGAVVPAPRGPAAWTPPDGVDRVVPVARIPLDASGAPALSRCAYSWPSAADLQRREAELGRVRLVANTPGRPALSLRIIAPGWLEGDHSGVDASSSAAIHQDNSAELSVLEGGPAAAPEAGVNSLVDALHAAAAAGAVIRCIAADGTEHVRTCADLLTDARVVAGGLAARSVPAGEPVLLQVVDPHRYFAALWGCILAGAAPVPLQVTQLRDRDGVERLRGTLLSLHNAPVLACESGAARVSQLVDDAVVWPLAELASAPCPPPPSPETICLMLLTSGSSGRPKAVTHNHRTLLAQINAMRDLYELSSSDVMLNWLPLDHVCGVVMTHMTAVVHRAEQIHAAPDPVLAQPTTWLDWLQAHEVTWTWAPNFAFRLVNGALANDDRRWDLGRLRVVINAGEAIESVAARRFTRLLSAFGMPESAMAPGWGMSETSSVSVAIHDFSLANTADSERHVGCGWPLAGFNARIVDEDGAVVPTGAEGKLEVGGACLHLGYYRLPERNARDFHDGWFNTGDRARIGPRGVEILGRADDTLVINGINRDPQDLEGAVRGVQGAVEGAIAVCQVRSAGASRPQIAMFFAPEKAADPAAVARRLRGAVARAVGASLERVVPVTPTTIGRTGIGKIKRPPLRRRFERGDFDPLVAPIDAALAGPTTAPAWTYRRTWPTRLASARPTPPGDVMMVVGDAAGAALADALSSSVSHVHVLAIDDALTAARPIAAVSAAVDARASEVPGGTDRALVLAPRLAAADEEDARPVELAALFGCARSLVDATELGIRRVIVVSRGGQQVVAGDEPSWRAAAAVAVSRCLALEWPAAAVTHLDLPAHPGREDISALVAELAAVIPQPEVAYRRGRRHVARLQAHNPGESVGPTLPVHRAPIVVTGGLGGVGQAMVEALIGRCASHVLVCGRRAADAAEADAGWQNLRKLADQYETSIAYVSVDVRDGAALQRAIRAWELQCRAPIVGAMHVAALFPGGLVTDADDDVLCEALAVRVGGLQSLATVVEDRPGAWLMDFGTVNGVLGAAGFSIYAAASRAGEAVCARLRQQGHAAWHVAWGRWAEAGQGQRLGAIGSSADHGIASMTTADAVVLAFSAMRASFSPVIIGLDGRAPPIAAGSRGPQHGWLLRAIRGQPASDDELASTWPWDAAAVLSSATGEQVEEAPQAGLESQLATLWSRILGVEVSDVNANFFDLGGDSLTLARMQRSVADVAGRSLALLDLFGHPTIRSLATFIAGSATPKPSSPDRAKRQLKGLGRLAAARRRATRRRG